jgi:hypothetical protein
MAPVAFHQQEPLDFPGFVRYLPVLAALTSDDAADFLSQPAAFYRYAFCLSGNPSGNLRHDTLFAVREFCSRLPPDALARFVAAFEPSEAGMRIVSVAVATVKSPAPGNPVCAVVKDFIARARHRSAFDVAAMTILVAKALPCLAGEGGVFDNAVRYVDTIIRMPAVHPVFVSLAAAVLHKLDMLGFPIDGSFLPRLVALAPHAVTPHLFKLIVRLCKHDRAKYADMAWLVPELVRMLGEEIGDGVNDGEDEETMYVMCNVLCRFLAHIINVCGDGEYGELLLSSVTACFAVCAPGLHDDVAKVFRSVIAAGSGFSCRYFEFFVGMAEFSPHAASWLAGVLRGFVVCLARWPEQCPLEIFGRAYALVNAAIQSQATPNEDGDVWWLASFVAWTLRAFPGGLDVQTALASAETVCGSAGGSEGPMGLPQWLQALAGYTLLAVVLSMGPADVGPTLLRQWAAFVLTQGLPSERSVALHAAAIAAEVAAFPQYAGLFAPLAERCRAALSEVV